MTPEEQYFAWRLMNVYPALTLDNITDIFFQDDVYDIEYENFNQLCQIEAKICPVSLDDIDEKTKEKIARKLLEKNRSYKKDYKLRVQSTDDTILFIHRTRQKYPDLAKTSLARLLNLSLNQVNLNLKKDIKLNILTADKLEEFDRRELHFSITIDGRAKPRKYPKEIIEKAMVFKAQCIVDDYDIRNVDIAEKFGLSLDRVNYFTAENGELKKFNEILDTLKKLPENIEKERKKFIEKQEAEQEAKQEERKRLIKKQEAEQKVKKEIQKKIKKETEKKIKKQLEKERLEKKKLKYISGELPIPSKNPKKTDLSCEIISDICKLTAMNDLNISGGLSPKDIREKYGIKNKNIVNLITTKRQPRHYDYWVKKLSK